LPTDNFDDDSNNDDSNSSQNNTSESSSIDEKKWTGDSSLFPSTDNLTFCWNCGAKITDPDAKWCERCRAPLDENDKIKVMNRTKDSGPVKCWRCGGTTSGDLCGSCGSPITKKGIQIMKDRVEDDIERKGPQGVAVLSPKSRQLQRIDLSYEELIEAVSKYVTIKDAQNTPNIGPQLLINEVENMKEKLEGLREDPVIKNNNLKVLIRKEKISPVSKEIVVRFYYWEQESPKEAFALKNIWINILLYLATIFTVALAGYFINKNLYTELEFASNLPLDITFYTVSLMGILTIHELGHFVVSRRKEINVTLPYFIPVPSFSGFMNLGTFGAVIRQKEPIATRDDLFDIGIAGPAAGFVVAVPIYLVGLALSNQVVTLPADYEPPTTESMPVILLDWIFQSIWYAAGRMPEYNPETETIIQHPMMFAGWIGFLLTGLNLMPVSQLDGGHTSRACFGERIHKILSIAVAILLIFNQVTFIFAIFILFMTLFQQHPGPVDDVSKVSTSKYVFVGIGYAIGILCLPLPINSISALFS
jgi:membrane-associated protease RseP (regulator of RpoE activity)